MRLYIQGPAFGLPSIDAECNAAVALLQLRAEDQYEIVPTHEQIDRLPYLVDGQAKLYGFSNIVRHFENKRISNEKSLDSKRRADSIAIASFIESNALTLLDISLYVGYDNYRLTTRPAYSKILPWHANYIIPPLRRSAARSRTEHLGVSSIDVDNVHEDMSHRPPGFEGVGKEPGFEAETQKRASLLLPRKDTVRSLLQRPEHSAIFKLHALADNFFEPLQNMLDGQDFLLGSEMNAVDCMLYGYLCLMLYPKVSQDWLASTMRRKCQKLTAYTERIHSMLGLSTNADQVLDLAQYSTKSEALAQRLQRNMSLPWTSPAGTTVSRTIRDIRKGIWDQLPIIGTSQQLSLSYAKPFGFLDRNLQAIILSTTVSLAAVTYVGWKGGLFIWPHGQEVHLFGRKRLSDYGHLGSALAGISLLGPQAGHG